mmetsp:Transcript_662/g.1019  ORF Transcript_662/g.1019 Transcript_662/m.1019 type:complete len:92 (+) Transcript_662:1830-2105(+)
MAGNDRKVDVLESRISHQMYKVAHEMIFCALSKVGNDPLSSGCRFGQSKFAQKRATEGTIDYEGKECNSAHHTAAKRNVSGLGYGRSHQRK